MQNYIFKQSNNLKILLILPNYWSGIGSMGRHLANSVKGVDYYFFKTSEISYHQKEFMKLVSSVDIVHWLANLSSTKFPPNFDIRKFPVPNIATIHHIDANLAGGEKEEVSKIASASICDAIQVVSKEWLGFVQSRTNIPVFLAHQAINPSQFMFNRMRSRPGNPFQIGTFGFARELRDRKRTDILLEALTILIRQGYSFDLVVQGPHWDKLLNPFIQQGINVRNLGYLSSRKALKSYRLLDLYICASDVEGGPLPVLEALASGVPVVSTRVGVADEALALGGGVLVSKGNSEQMAAAISTIMDNSLYYHQLETETVQVSREFSWSNIGKEYLDMYQFVLDNKPKVVAKKPRIGSAKLQRFIRLMKNKGRNTSSF